MKKRILSFGLALIIALSSFVGLFGCIKDEYFTVTFSPSEEYLDARLADGFTEEDLVQRVKDASELKPPTFISDRAYHVGWNDAPSKVKGDTTLTAVWYKKEFIVKFEPGAVDAVKVKGEEEIKTNSPSTIEKPVYTRKGYTMDPTWGGFNFDTVNSNVTITAKWIPNVYKIYFEEQEGGSLDFAPEQNVKTDITGKQYIEVNYDQPLGNLPTPQKDGVAFGAWKMQNVSTKVFGDSVYKYDHDITLEALWMGEDDFRITYNNVETTNNPISYSVGTSLTLNNPVRAGYEFLGWTYLGQDTPTTEAKIHAEDIGDKEFTANWRVKTYTLELNGLNGAQLSNKYIQTTYGELVGEIPTPVRDGFEFVAWTTENGTVITKDTVWNIDDDAIVLTAKYTRIYTIKFVLKYTYKNVEVCSNLVGGTYEELGLVKSETEENVYLLENVKENTALPILPTARPYTLHKDPTNSYLFRAWVHRREKPIIVEQDCRWLVNETMFPGTYDSGVVVLEASCKTEWIDGWY